MAHLASKNLAGIECVIPDPDEPFSLLAVRKVAAQVPEVNEFYLNDTSKVVSFRNTVHDCRINVYYTTGTVGTCLFHPISGKTQLFRRGVTMQSLKEILKNPRTHTGTGYYTKGTMTDIFRPENVLSEEDALKEKLSTLEPQVQAIKARLAEIEHQKLLRAQKRAAALQAQREELQRQAEAKLKAEAAAEAARRVQEEKEQMEKQAAEQKAKLHRINQRGNNYHYNIDYEDLPYSAATVACVALAEGGSVYVTDDGTCYSEGLPDDVEQILSNQKFANVAYIALGECGQYYIRKKNGRTFYCGGRYFDEEIRASNYHPEFVAFGAWGTYFIQFRDGTRKYSDDLEDRLPSYVYNSIANEGVGVLCVALGCEVSYYSSTISFCVVYADGDLHYAGIDGDLQERLENKHRSTKVKQVLLGQDNNFLIRYS